MKIVSIIGSPHGMKGQTGILLDGMLDAVRGTGAEVTAFSLSSLTVKPCQACDTCHKKGICAINDDFNTVKRAFEDADGLILASPNYFTSVSAQMKALFDRCCGLMHLQAIEGKYAAAVVTSGGPGGEEVEAYMLRFMRSLGFTTVGSMGVLGRQMSEETRQPHLAAAAELGARLVGAIDAKQQFPEQQDERKAVMERMKGLMQAQQDHWPYEYKYWVERRRFS